MAVDPNLSLDQKRALNQRGRSLQRGLEAINTAPATLLTNPRSIAPVDAAIGTAQTALDRLHRGGIVGIGSDAAQTAGDIAGAVLHGVGDAASRVAFGTDGDHSAAANAAKYDFSNVHANGHVDTMPADMGATANTGLTRIFKSKGAHGENVYSNVGPAPAGAETRYYNQYGNRQTDFSDKGLAEARASLDYAKRGELARMASDAQAQMDQLPPEDRRALIVAQMEQSGQNQRSALDRGLRREVAAAQLDNAHTLAGIAGAKTAYDQTTNERTRFAKDPNAYAQEQAAMIANMSDAEKAAYFANPNDPRAGLAQEGLRRAAVAGGADPNVNLAQITRTSGLRKFLGHFTPGPTPEYTDNTGLIYGNGVDLPGYDPAAIDAIINGRRNARINARQK